MKIYLLDSMSCYVGEAEVDPYAALPKCAFDAPPRLTGSQVAQWVDGEWAVLPERPVAQLDPSQVKTEIVTATQQRLDDFARTRNYDSVLSLCTYATSPNPKFRAEGQYGVEARDATWSKLLEIFNAVQAGQRPVPVGYADVEPELPELVWPDEEQTT